ncbi:MAG: Uma2 family endonuclease [Candidatus Electronema sp. V4]|uniref:Uma2 family endonuclease n=1 Tax=Candidatus Electronema sp. V4 TaxID=3454756 RepID=UPI0040553A16
MNWQEVCEHPSLQDLPFKIELNEDGKVLMTPVKIYHAALQGELEFLLRSLLRSGKTLPECAVQTRKGVRVADVVWASDAVFAQIKHETTCSVCPEICIEVISASNTDEEMKEKRKLYFEQGAKEVWLCSEQGELRFFTARDETAVSSLVPAFPHRIEL